MKIEKAKKDIQARIDGELAINGKDDCVDLKIAVEVISFIILARVTAPGSVPPLFHSESPE